jgi:hypothetical protein
MLRPNITQILFAGLFLASCHSGQKFQASTSVDKPLFAAINELNKHPENQKAQKDIEVFYNQSKEHHEEAISVYESSMEGNRWDKIISELNALQHIYNSISATPGATRFVKPKNYLGELQSKKEDAAEDFYNRGASLLALEGRENSMQAYQAFKKSDQYISGYKEVSRLTKEAYEKSVVNVVINPIEDDNLFISVGNGWGLNDFGYRPEDYQQSLVRDLGGRTGNYLPARFYTNREARVDRIDPDWMVDLRWRNIDAIPSYPQQYTRQASKSVQIGSDTSGKPVYRTVYATLYITQRTFSVRGDLDYMIKDIEQNSSIDHGLLSDEVNWSESYATYSGDSRALGQEDWYLINNTSQYNNRNPSKADILNTLMRKIYPDLKRRIQRAVEL